MGAKYVLARACRRAWLPAPPSTAAFSTNASRRLFLLHLVAVHPRSSCAARTIRAGLLSGQCLARTLGSSQCTARDPHGWSPSCETQGPEAGGGTTSTAHRLTRHTHRSSCRRTKLDQWCCRYRIVVCATSAAVRAATLPVDGATTTQLQPRRHLALDLGGIS